MVLIETHLWRYALYRAYLNLLGRLHDTTSAGFGGFWSRSP